MLAVGVLGGLYGVLFPDRSDYLGHFLAGTGGTLLLLALVVTAVPARVEAVLVTVGIVVAALSFGLLDVWTLVARSAIPLRLDGTVTSIDTRQEKPPGADDAWFVGVDGEERHLDTALARSLSVGDTVHKGRWSDSLLVDGKPRSLRLSKDAEAMMILAPAVALTCAALALPSRRRRRPSPSGGGEDEHGDLPVGA